MRQLLLRLLLPLRSLSIILREKVVVRILVTMLFIYLAFLLPIDNHESIIVSGRTQDLLMSIFAVILTLVLYVLTLYTVLAQEENDLINRKDKIMRLIESCSKVKQEAKEVLRVIDETLRDVSRTWVRWAVYELPYAYTMVFPLVIILYLYQESMQINELLALFLPARVTWVRILGVFAFILIVSGLTLAYAFRRGYERKFLEFYAWSKTQCSD